MNCFLCNPDQNWVYAQSEDFYAMLGLGPIVEGYSLIGTVAHVPSMLDLTEADVEKLGAFTARIRELLGSHYGDAIITEHGRVAPCVDRDRDGQQAHCFHAHRLVFPMSSDLTDSIEQYGVEVMEYPNFKECWRNFSWRGEYLYYERANGSCVAASAPMRTVRQFFRHRLAESLGHPELADWKEYPRLKFVEAARNRLMEPGRK
jgi:hypothetical protein